MEHIVGDTFQPIVLHRFVLISQDVEYGRPSWSWAGSWETRIDTMGRETWFVEDSPASTQAKRNFVVVLPYQPSTQTWDPSVITTDDDLQLIDASTGQKYAEFSINLVRPTQTHVEIHLEMID